MITMTVTFIRHGESTDNLRSVWAGWQDAPLSSHGMNQARALGRSFANTRLTAIHASTLKRAFSTAQALQEAQPAPQPLLTSSPLLREQHFGRAEGKPWTMHVSDDGLSLEEMYAKEIYPVPYGRKDKFPEGESLDDLADRAEQANKEIVMPYVWQAARSGTEGVHIAIVSHGLCISELIAGLVRKDSTGSSVGNYKGLLNTAWTRVQIEVKGTEEGRTLDFPDDHPPPLIVRVTHVNRHGHIDNVKRTKGGIGSAAYDPKQQDIRAFFGGAAVEAPVEVQEHSESNARDEVATTTSE